MTQTPASADPAGDALLLALTDAIRSATGPEMQQAQALLLRRLATESEVIPGRSPSPKNVTEVGGWYNLLTDLGETGLRRELVTSVLGLPDDPFPSGIGGAALPPMRLQTLPNDQPAGDAAGTVPLSVSVRSDLATGLQAALDTVHAAGGVLPLWQPALALPTGTSLTPMPDPLPYLGREVWLAPTAALTDPATDSLVLGRASTDAGTGYRVGIRVTPPAAPLLDWSGLVWDSVGGVFVEREIGTIGLLALETATAGSAFQGAPVTTSPASRADLTWARLRAVSGLLPGVTELGDELALLWTPDQIANSVFGTHTDAVWDGTAFA